MKGKSAPKSSRARYTSTKPTLRTRSQLGQHPKSPEPMINHLGAQSLVQKPPANATNNVQAVSTSTPQQLNFEQSIQIMQTLFHACLSSMLFQRSIFPSNCYETRYYINNSEQWTYRDFIGARQGEVKGDGAGGPMLALKKNVSARVDRFLELLETGIFDAMRRGFLKSLRVSIYESTDQPDDILESWTLTVHYMDTGSPGERLAHSFDVKEGDGTKVTLKEAKLSLNDFIRKLTGMCVALPALPAEKNIALEILYTADRPEGYFAPGFPYPVYDLAKFPSNDQWERVTSDVALMSTSHHAAALRVSHLSNLVPNNENCLPCVMICTEEVNKLDDVMSDLKERAAAVSNTRSKSKKSKATSRSLSPTQELLPNTLDITQVQIPSSQVGERTHRRSSSSHGQSSGTFENLMKPLEVDHVERDQLRKMLRSPPSGSNTQATQPVARQHHSNEIPISRLIFSSMKIDQADRDRDATLPPRKEASRIFTAYQHMSQFTIRCTCGHQEEEGDMIECEFCGMYQHIHCCGYHGKEDPQIPIVYMCYGCLLKDEDKPYDQVRDQSVYRRALWLLKDTSFEDTKSLARVLHCTKAEADKLIKRFRSQGLLAPKDACNKGNSMIILSNSSVALETVDQLYFEPSFGITHHLENSTEFEITGEVSSTRSNKRTLDSTEEEAEPSPKRIMCASGASFINGNEVNTPKTGKKQ